MIHVEVAILGAGSERVRDRALVDSGADSTVLPNEFAEDFELDLTQLPIQAGTGASGPTQFRVWLAGATVQLRGLRHTLRVQPVLFGAVPVPVLGRAELFTRFRVAFDERAETFSLDPY